MLVPHVAQSGLFDVASEEPLWDLWPRRSHFGAGAGDNYKYMLSRNFQNYTSGAAPRQDIDFFKKFSSSPNSNLLLIIFYVVYYPQEIMKRFTKK